MTTHPLAYLRLLALTALAGCGQSDRQVLPAPSAGANRTQLSSGTHSGPLTAEAPDPSEAAGGLNAPPRIRRVDRFQGRDQYDLLTNSIPEREPEPPQWIGQTTDYVRNEMPLEFLRKRVADRFQDVESRSEVYVNLRRSERPTKYQVFLRQLADQVYGYAIYRADDYAAPVQRGRFKDLATESFLWIDGRGTHSTWISLNRDGPPTNRAEIPGADVDVIAIDAGAKAFVERGISIKLRGTSTVLPPAAALATTHSSLPSKNFSKFYVTVLGAPAGRLRYLSWEECDFTKP